MNDLAIVALTPNGLALGKRLVKAVGFGDVVSGQGDTRQTVQALFEAGRPLVCASSAGRDRSRQRRALAARNRWRRPTLARVQQGKMACDRRNW